MLRLRLAAFGGTVLLMLSACTKSASPKVELESVDQKFSYAIGQQIGRGLKSQNLNVNLDVLAASIRDVMEGAPSRLSQEEIQKTMAAMQGKMAEKQMGVANENKAKADKFLADNSKQKGVTTTASGLQYEVLTTGKGPIPKATDEVKVHYKGTLLDGTEFDSSYKRGQPATFPINGVIKGWTEALQLMKVGSKWKLSIPPGLAYGEQGRPSIPPNSLLQFEVELLGIEKRK